MPEWHTDIAIIGGGLGGCSAALSATTLQRKVILTEETDWIGGQLTTQAVPPDEHRWIEHFGCTRRYRHLRNLIRQIYKDHYPLLPSARFDPYLNPGKGWVSLLCCEPKVALTALQLMLAYPQSKGDLKIFLRCKPIAADVNGDRVISVTLLNLETGKHETIYAEYFLDATELGDLLALTGTEYVIGSEGSKETGEIHTSIDPNPENVQAITWGFALSYDPHSDRTIDKPEQYDFWRNYTPNLTPPWTGNLLDWTCPSHTTSQPRHFVLFPHESDNLYDCLWTYRRVICQQNYPSDAMGYEVTIVNWPQNDYWLRGIVDKSEDEMKRALNEAKQLSLSLLYWLQTEAPRPDGGVGYRGLFLRHDIMEKDGFAKFPYIRESRRIKAVFTVTECHVGVEARKAIGKEWSEPFPDSVGIGWYGIDLHPTVGGDNGIYLATYPFQIPLGALLPVRTLNLLPACKNIGTTHITNGCYRLHPIEWNIGESAGALAGFCLNKGLTPHQVRENQTLMTEFQSLLQMQGIDIAWPHLQGL